MGYRYPNGAFSVILDVPNNPYASTDNYTSIQLAERTFHLERSLAKAKIDLQNQIKEQKEIYFEMEQYFYQISNGKLNLNTILQQSQKDKKKEEAEKLSQEEYTQALNSLMFEYKSKYIGYFSKRNQRNYNEIDQKIIELINLTHDKLGELNKKQKTQLDTYIKKINKANEGTSEAHYEVSLSPTGEVTINDSSIRINLEELKRIQIQYANLIAKKNSERGKDSPRFTFANANALKNLKGMHKDKDFRDIYTSMFGLGLKHGGGGFVGHIREAFLQADIPIEISNELASQIATELLKTGLEEEASSAVLQFQHNPYSEESISSVAGEAFEFSVQAELEDSIEKIIGKTDFQKLFEGGVITEKTRVLVQARTTRNTRSKTAQANFDRQRQSIEMAHKKMLDYLDESIKLSSVKDKIDNYLIVKDKNDPTKAKFTLAFSDKLQYGADNISLVGSKHTESLTSSLLNSLDLIGKLAIPQETFLFSALNSSPVSAFGSYGAQEKIAATLEKLLTSLVFELAYNPDNFTAQLGVLHQNLNFSSNKTLYLHRSGPKVIPSFQILESTLKSIESLELQSETLQPINVNIFYESRSASEFWDDQRAKEYGGMPPEEKRAEWNFVASQVADSIYLQVLMNLSPILFDIEKLNNII